MKNIKAIAAALLLGICPAVWADSFSQGTNALAQTNINTAYTDLTSAVAASPTDSANVYLALARLLALPTQPAGSNFLDRLGFLPSGRDVYDWTDQPSKNAKDHLEIPGNLDADEFTAELRTNVTVALAASEANLAGITDTNFTLFLPGSVTHFADVTMDYGDVQMTRAVLDAGVFFFYTLHSANLDAQFSSVSNIVATQKTIGAVLKANPGLLTIANADDLAAARGVFSNAINAYMAASQFIRSRPPGLRRLFNLDAGEDKAEESFRNTLVELQNSLSGPVTLSSDTNYTINLSDFFGGQHSLRSLLPVITNNDFIWDSFPDPTLGGVVDGLTETNLGKFFIKKDKLEAELRLPGVAYTVLASASGNVGGGELNGVVQGADGNFYGTTPYGGAYGWGVFYQATPGGGFKVLYSFGGAVNMDGTPRDGGQPSSLILGSDHSFYGTTSYGGANDNNSGTIFKISSSGNLATLYQFGQNADGNSYGGNPLVEGKNGIFYGTTTYGGNNSSGIIFQFTPPTTVNGGQGQLVTLYSFDLSYDDNGYTDSGSGALVQGSDGNFYGTAQYEGSTGGGSIFQFNPAGVGQFTTLYSFPPLFDEFGYEIVIGATLVEGSDGNFYGTTQYGGNNDLYNPNPNAGYFGGGDGALFRITPKATNSFTNLYSFDQNQFDGFCPIGALVQGTDGSFYGTTANGGANGHGTLFRFTPGGPSSFVVWFSDGLGKQNTAQNDYSYSFSAGLTKGSGGLYGTAPDGGRDGDGVVFSLNVNSSVLAMMPTITSHPAPVSVPQGAALSLTVAATGPGPFTWQWLSNNASLADVGAVSGSGTSNLVINPALTGDTGSYSVVVANANGSVTSKVWAVTVTLDTVKPAVAVLSPAVSPYARSTAPMTFLGTASDNALVANVNYWITNLDGSAPLSGAAVLSAGKGFSSNWSVSVSPSAGSNVFAAQSADFSGNLSPIKSVKFFLKSPVTLTVASAGTGNGAFKGKASFAGDAVPADGAMLNVGEAYSITALPGANCFFVNWTGTAGTSNNPTLGFIMESNTSLTANFVTNIFLGMAGTYNGLFSSEDVGMPTEQIAGLIGNLKVSSQGVYSGSVSLAGSSPGISGTFSHDGFATNVVTTTQDGHVKVELIVNSGSSPRTISGSVIGTNSILVNGLPTQGWTSAVSLFASLTNTHLDAGTYTMLIPGQGNPVIITPANVTVTPVPPAPAPSGSGYALLANNPGSAKVPPSVTLMGALADGAALSQNVPIGEDNGIPIYQNLYTNKGLLFGRLSLSGPAAPSGTLVWIRQASVSGLFTNGFTNFPVVLGSAWTNSLPLDTVIPAGSPLVISGGGLAASLAVDVSVNNTNLVAASATPGYKSGSVNTNNGQLTVAFTNGAAVVTGRGAVLQNMESGGGFFLMGSTNAGSISLSPPTP